MATGGRFSQTNNGRMFICGRPHLGRSACLPLSPDRGIGVFVLAFPGRRVCLSLSSALLYFFVLFSGLQCCARSAHRSGSVGVTCCSASFFQPKLCYRFDPVRRVCRSLLCFSRPSPGPPPPEPVSLIGPVCTALELIQHITAPWLRRG